MENARLFIRKDEEAGDYGVEGLHQALPVSFFIIIMKKSSAECLERTQTVEKVDIDDVDPEELMSRPPRTAEEYLQMVRCVFLRVTGITIFLCFFFCLFVRFLLPFSCFSLIVMFIFFRRSFSPLQYFIFLFLSFASRFLCSPLPSLPLINGNDLQTRERSPAERARGRGLSGRSLLFE